MDTVAALPDERMYAGLAAALGTCGVPAAQQAEVWSLLAGVLHVGNVRFTGEDAAAIVDPEVAATACRLLQSEVSGGLTARSMTVGSETTLVPLTAEKAAHARDALAKAVYARLFEWIVAAVNTTIAGDAQQGARFIGLLDVFGFEFFGTNNSFEQLAINFANEKLQQFLSWRKVPPALLEDSAPSACLVAPRAEASPTLPGAQPEPLGGWPWPQQPASDLQR